jgi:hypothetical protein
VCRVLQNTTGRTERRWLNCLGLATWPEVVRRYCLFHPAKHQDSIITDAASKLHLPLLTIHKYKYMPLQDMRAGLFCTVPLSTCSECTMIGSCEKPHCRNLRVWFVQWDQESSSWHICGSIHCTFDSGFFKTATSIYNENYCRHAG